MTRKNRQTKNAKDVQDRKRMSKNIKRLCELKTVLMEKTNADSTGLMDSTWMKISEIDEVLEGKGVHASRQTLYEDLKALSDLADLNIESCGKTRNRKYAAASLFFSHDEIKNLLQAVRASYALSASDKKSLTAKLKKLLPRKARKTVPNHEVTTPFMPESRNVADNLSILKTAIKKSTTVAFKYLAY